MTRVLAGAQAAAHLGDDALQMLYAAGLALRRLAPDTDPAALEELSELLHGASETVRRVIDSLSLLDGQVSPQAAAFRRRVGHHFESVPVLVTVGVDHDLALEDPTFDAVLSVADLLLSPLARQPGLGTVQADLVVTARGVRPRLALTVFDDAHEPVIPERVGAWGDVHRHPAFPEARLTCRTDAAGTSARWSVGLARVSLL